MNKIPPLSVDTNSRVKDSCNCCQKCDIKCCWPRKVKKHKKHHHNHMYTEDKVSQVMKKINNMK